MRLKGVLAPEKVPEEFNVKAAHTHLQLMNMDK